MLDVSPENLWREIQQAELFRDAHLGRVQKLVEQYTGIGYREDWSADWSENHLYEFIRLTTAAVIFDNPRVRVRTRRPGVQAVIAQAMQFGLNRWVKDNCLRRVLKRVYANTCFAFSAVMVVNEPRRWIDPRAPSVEHWPQMYPIEQNRFFFDPMCHAYGQARFVGHKWVRDKDDLLEAAELDDTWIEDAIQMIADDSGVESLQERDDRRTMDVSRKELVGYEVWVPEINMQDPEDGFNGTIYTVAQPPGNDKEHRITYLREPRPYYGPRTGPYTLFGVYPVPGDPYPLSPFAAMYSQMEELNDIVKASNKGIREYKRIVLYSAENPDLAIKLQKAPDMVGIPVRGFAKDQMEVVEIGGITEQHLKQQSQALDRLDRNTGLSRSHRGEIKTGSTATEIAVADASKQETLAYVKQEFTDATVQALHSVAWFLYNDDRVQFPLGEEAAFAMGMGEPWFRGGSPHDVSGMSYGDLELEIEPYSMERMNESLARAQYAEMMALALQAAPVIPHTPFYDWKQLFDRGGNVVNDPEFGSFFNPEIAGQIMGMLMGGAPAGGGGGGAPGIGTPAKPDTPSGTTSISPGYLPGNLTGGQIAAERGKTGAGV